MSINSGGGNSWLSTPISHGKINHQFDDRNGLDARSRTPGNLFDAANMVDSATVQDEGSQNTEEESQRLHFKELFERSEAKLAALFGGEVKVDEKEDVDEATESAQLASQLLDTQPTEREATRKSARIIDEDDYDDDDDDDDEDDEDRNTSPLKRNSTNALSSPPKSGSSPTSLHTSSSKNGESSKENDSQEQPKTSEDARKQLEEAKKATENAVKRSFHTIFYTYENDRVAMLEQQKLEESEKQIDAEMDHSNGPNAKSGQQGGEQHGTLGSTNLGSASLTLKHLIARIDQKRDRVAASDAELRSLMNEVRKNRSKWSSEEQIGQEELYEAADKVLTELKAMTEYSAPFLTRVNKRDAPDYYNIIKQPMDLGSMTKKLKLYTYKSKTEFVTDLELVWSNCLKYNGAIGHPLRRNANAMRKEAEKLIPLIPDIVVRPRAEVEAEERRRQNIGIEDDGGEESDDEPIMSSRGRKAPGKTGAKGTSSKTRKEDTASREEGTPGVDQKPALHLNGLLGNVMREGSESAIDGSQNGFSTPPLGANGSITPSGVNGISGAHSDVMDLDGPSLNGILNQSLGVGAEDEFEDEEYKIWKQFTKKHRALVAKERHQLFKTDKLPPDGPALYRTKAGMRRRLRLMEQASAEEVAGEPGPEGPPQGPQASETLAEGMNGEEERILPDYYDPLSGIPDLYPKRRWIEDDEGKVIDTSATYLRIVPPGHFTAPQSSLVNKMEANMKQMQETRKLCSKIGVVKQMQLQQQTYSNQFQKYDLQPFVEQDVEPMVVSDDGPIMSNWVCRAALQRSVGKICYHAGFEELQPSALDTITDIAGDFFGKIARSFNVFRETHKVPATGVAAENGQKWQDRYTKEETILHTLGENGLDVESLEAYVSGDMDRFGGKLGVMHERMKAHLTDILRPALESDAGADGVGAFKDGSDQFITGDFAEELGEDFFGLKDLGLFSGYVPLHLLRSKIHATANIGLPGLPNSNASVVEELPPFEKVTKELVESEQMIGLAKAFFRRKLEANHNEPLVEDIDLPIKQQFPKPRLPPTGKITSPRKRPLREQLGNAKKKKKLEAAAGEGKGDDKNALTANAKKLKLSLPGMNGTAMERDPSSQGEKDDGSVVGMMSPESLER